MMAFGEAKARASLCDVTRGEVAKQNRHCIMLSFCSQ